MKLSIPEDKELWESIPTISYLTSGSAVSVHAPLPQAPPGPGRPRLRPIRGRHPQEKAPIAVLLLGTAISLMLVVAGALLITQWANIRLAIRENLAMQAEILRLRAENEVLMHELASLQSIASLEENAVKLGMERPEAVSIITPDPRVVAPPETPAAEEEPDLWQQVQSLLLQMLGG